MTTPDSYQNPAVLLKPLDKLRAFQVYTLYTLWRFVQHVLNTVEVGGAGF